MVVLVRAWILLSTLLVASGWILSALHELNRGGYLAVFSFAALVTLWYWHQSPPVDRPAWRREWHKICHRFRRPSPLLFLVLVLMSLAAGLLYCPYNADSNSYRIPRVFHWLGQEQWHWIHTADVRMNTAGTGFEWLSAPLILFTGYDRGIFLINWVSYLLLPGLIFSVFIRLGVRRSVAWWWMWLLPTGWCYVWQAQSTNNDSFAVIYAVASVDLALRARQSGRAGDWWLALLAAALVTGVKQTGIPLALVSAIALLPGKRFLFIHPLRTALVLALAALISALPVSLLNFQHAGDWTGALGADPVWVKTILPSPFWGIIGNVFCLPAQNFEPPIFPMAGAWNSAMESFIQTPFGGHFKSFESFGHLDHAVNRDSAGIGLFIFLLTLISVGWALAHKPHLPAGPKVARDVFVRLLWLVPWLALLVFMAKVGTFENARQLAPYYVLLFPVLLVLPGHVRLVRQRWWRRLAWAVSVATAVVIFSSRTCPLFPAQTIFGWLHETYPQSPAIDHLFGSYSCYNAALIERHSFQADLPADEKVLGYYNSLLGGAEPGHWQPFGIRRVERIVKGDTVAYIRSRGIRYIMVDDQELKTSHQSLSNWLDEHEAELISHVAMTIQYGHPPEILYLVCLRSPLTSRNLPN